MKQTGKKGPGILEDRRQNQPIKWCLYSEKCQDCEYKKVQLRIIMGSLIYKDE